MEKRNQIHKEIEETFVSRMQSLGVKKGTEEYSTARTEFFTGAMAAMHAIVNAEEFKNTDEMDKPQLGGFYMPPIWVFGIMRGDDFEDNPG